MVKKETIALMLIISSAMASFGQTAGPLDFGSLEIGEAKTLSYTLINTGNETVSFQITVTEDITAEPMEGEILPFSNQIINVTVNTKNTGNYSGLIKALALSNASGAAVLQVEMTKNYVFEVLPEEELIVPVQESNESDESAGNREEKAGNLPLILTVSFIFALLFSYIAIRLIKKHRGEKKK